MMQTKTPNAVALPGCFTTTIEHLHFNRCLDQLLELVQMKTSTRLVIIAGPTGAGKSTLVERFKRELEALSAAERPADPEVVAYGSCAVSSRGQTAFSWKDTYIQIFKSLRHPFPDSRASRNSNSGEAVDDIASKGLSPEAAQRLSSDRLFRKLQTTITHRRPKALIFDEAHHLLRVASSQSLVNQLEHIKYIADETKTLHVLLGTYELIKFMDLSSALIRRRESIHFQRYIYNPEAPAASLEEFAKVVAVFARDLADASDVDLLADVPNLYQGSVGCVGVLRDWLCRAYERAARKRSRISRGILKETMLVARDRLALIEAAEEGEEYFAKRLDGEEEYLTRLGFSQAHGGEKQPKPGKAAGKSNPFTRLPHNDTIGLSTLDPTRQKTGAA